MIKVVDLQKRFGTLRVLNGITNEVREGEVVCVIGPSGSGKSTFLRCLNLLEIPDGGQIYFDGVEITDLKKVDINQIRAEMGMVFQRFNLFPHMNVVENICLAPLKVRKCSREEAEARAYDLLRKVGLQEKALAYPDTLSGGQQQRVAIARALAMDPDVLLLDEITSALDPELAAEVLDVLRDLARSTDITMLCVTHAMKFAKDVSHRVLMFDRGKIVEDKPPEELFNAPEHDRTKQFLRSVLDEV